MSRNPAAWTMMYHGWFDADISDSAKLTIWAIYSFFNQQTREWIEIPTVERVAQLRKLTIRAVKDHYQELEEAGLIRRKRTPVIGGGSALKIEIVEPSRHNPTYSDCDSEGAENCTLTKVQKIAPSIKSNTVNPKTGLSSQGTKVPFDDKHETSSSSGESFSPEPFEGTPKNGWSKRQLENLRHYGSVGRPRRPLCDFQPSDEANILQAFSKLDLGEIRAIFTQQQADTPEFVSECLSELSLARRKKGGVRNPIGLLVVIRDKKWADGLFLEREKIKAEEKDSWMDDMVAYAVSCLKRQG